MGINADSVQTELFNRWTQEHGISATVVPVSGFPDALEQIEAGSLDCVVAPESSKCMEAGLTGITCIGSSDIYFAVNKNKPELKEELDRAMAKIENINPYYAEDLYRRYMNSASSAVLSDEELEWLDGHGPIRIAYLENNLAVSGHDPQTGELIGAIAEYIRFAEGCLANRRLEFEPVPYSNLIDEMQALKNREAD
ncbi:MAG: histidine kinase, partial [Huintestinicola sp.]